MNFEGGRCQFSNQKLKKKKKKERRRVFPIAVQDLCDKKGLEALL